MSFVPNTLLCGNILGKTPFRRAVVPSGGYLRPYVLRASLAAARRPAKFPGSSGNASVQDLIRRLTRGDSDGDSRAVTYEEAVGTAVAGNLSRHTKRLFLGPSTVGSTIHYT